MEEDRLSVSRGIHIPFHWVVFLGRDIVVGSEGKVTPWILDSQIREFIARRRLFL